MTTPAEVIARVAASMARTKAEEAARAARSAAYTGPERRRRPRDDTQPSDDTPTQPAPAAPP